MPAKCFDRNWPGADREVSSRGLKVTRTLFEADEGKDGQGVRQSSLIARHSFDQLRHAGRVRQDQRQCAGIPRRQALLGRRQVGDLSNQDGTVGVVGPLEAEVLTPMKEKIGRGILPEKVAEFAELGGMLFVKEDRLQVQAVEQHQPAQTVSPLNFLGISPETLGDASDRVKYLGRTGSIFRDQPGFWVRMSSGALVGR